MSIPSTLELIGHVLVVVVGVVVLASAVVAGYDS